MNCLRYNAGSNSASFSLKMQPFDTIEVKATGKSAGRHDYDTFFDGYRIA